MRGSAQVVYGNLNWSTVIQGVTPDYFEARDWGVASGRMLRRPRTWTARPRSPCSGQTVGAEPVRRQPIRSARSIRIKKVPFTVIGVLERKGQTTWGQDQDDLILIPLSTAKKKVLGTNQLQSPRRSDRSPSASATARLMGEAEEQIRELLRQRHRLQPYQDDDFQVRNLSEMFAAQEESARGR